MSVSRLGLHDGRKARQLTLDAARLGLRHAPDLHYTQGAQRWEGIAHRLRAWRGEYPHHADCSAFATWCLWQGLGHFRLSDIVNGEDWRAGYTGTMLQHGVRVTGHRRVGDCVLYGHGWPGKHVAVYVGNGHVISFGSEPGPFLLPYNYRGDVMETRRYI